MRGDISVFQSIYLGQSSYNNKQNWNLLENRIFVIKIIDASHFFIFSKNFMLPFCRGIGPSEL